MSNANDETKLGYQEARERFEEAEALLAKTRPQLRRVEEFPAGLAIVLLMIIPIPSAIATAFGKLAFDSYIPNIIGAIVLGINILIIYRLEKYNPHSSNVFDRFLYKVCLTERQKEHLEFEIAQEKIYKDSKEIHQLLVNKVVNELKETGAYDTVNDLSDFERDHFVYINPNTGIFVELFRSEFLRATGQKDMPNNDALNELILSKIKDENHLLGKKK